MASPSTPAPARVDTAERWWTVIRQALLVVFGMAGVGYEATTQSIVRPVYLGVYTLAMGLPWLFPSGAPRSS